MTRKRNKMSELPTIVKQTATAPEVITAPEPIAEACVTSTISVGVVTVTAPTMEWESGYVRRKLDVALNSTQAAKLKAIQLGLEQKEAQLENGKYVANPVDAIRWLLENAV